MPESTHMGPVTHRVEGGFRDPGQITASVPSELAPSELAPSELAPSKLAPSELAVPRRAPLRRARFWLARTAPVTLPPLAMLCAALWSISGASFWRDEASTLSAVRRPLPELWHMLGRTDAVHGLYYLLMWGVGRALGMSELGMRLPSAIAVSAAALGVAVLGRRLMSSRVGLLAGLFFVILPVTSRYGQEARSYALVMALAVLASYLLVRAEQDPVRPGPWLACYALVVVVMGYANVMSLLLLPAHALTLLWNARAACASSPGQGVPPRARRVSWLTAVAAAGVALIPMLVIAWQEQHDTERVLQLTSWAALGSVVDGLSGSGLLGSWLVLPVAVLLVAAGIWRSANGYGVLTRLALPWLALPTPVLLAAGLFRPVFTSRYILFCVPAVALLAGSGLDRLVTHFAEHKPASARRWTAIAAAAIVVAAAVGLPAQLAYRAPGGHVDNFRLIAQTLGANERRGDSVIYDPDYWRQINAAYPASFVHLRDIALARTPEQENDFSGTQVSAAQLRTRLRAVHRVWLIELDPFRRYDPLQGRGWHMTRQWPISDFTLTLYTRS
jgi:mannosyltransferase